MVHWYAHHSQKTMGHPYPKLTVMRRTRLSGSCFPCARSSAEVHLT